MSDIIRPGAGLLSLDEVSVESSDVELSRLPADHIPPSVRLTKHPVRLLLLGEDSVPDIDVSHGSVVRLLPGRVHQCYVLRKDCLNKIYFRYCFKTRLRNVQKSPKLSLQDNMTVDINLVLSISICSDSNAGTVPDTRRPLRVEVSVE